MLTNGLTDLRARLDSNEPQPFPVLEELRQQGLRDYLALAIDFSGDAVSYDSDGVLSSFATRSEQVQRRTRNTPSAG